MSNLLREEFEVAFVARCKKKGEVARLDRFDDGRYEYLDASDAWWGWLASRECLVIEIPDEDGMQGHLWAPDVVAAMEAAGVKVKS